MIHAVATLMHRPRPADIVLHTLVAAFRSAHGEFRRSGANDIASGEDVEALTLALALVPARTRDGLADKGRVLRTLMLGDTVECMIEGGVSSELRLLGSYVEDALTLAEGE
jgi:hypothetical protein